MNYRHSYHAGNFADAFKHIVLIELIQCLLKKDSAFCYLDTHAGIGCYNLLSAPSQTTFEFKTGVRKLFRHPQPPNFIEPYLSCVKKLNQDNVLKTYPGSPWFARQFLRPQDRMVLCELHPEDFKTLKQFFRTDTQTAVHHHDGYQGLKAFLPPKERRGLVLIDPPYENPHEFLSIPDIVSRALERWETGIYAVWYPIKTGASAKQFHRALAEKIQKPILITELCIHPDDVSAGLNGSGMAIINPPYQLDKQLDVILPWLWETLSVDGKGRYCVKFIGN